MREPADPHETRRDLTLMLLFLSSWQEKGSELRRAWKGFDFTILDELNEQDFVRGTKTAKSVFLTPAGIERARGLLQGSTPTRPAALPAGSRASEADTAGKARIMALEVAIEGVKPRIWRRITIPAHAPLDTLHQAIQVAFGWESYHLYEFRVGERSIGIPDHEAGWGEPVDDARKTLTQDIFSRLGDVCEYVYDFGDNWVHSVTFVSAEPAKLGLGAPSVRCLGGERAAPPEDCGGVHGYQELIAALGNKRHKRHKELREWAGEYDPEAFDAEAVSAALRGLTLPRRARPRR